MQIGHAVGHHHRHAEQDQQQQPHIKDLAGPGVGLKDDWCTKLLPPACERLAQTLLLGLFESGGCPTRLIARLPAGASHARYLLVIG